MQKFEVIILPLAEEDIKENTDYIFFEKQSPQTALSLLKGFYDVIEKLSIMPEKYQYDEDENLAALYIRKCYYNNYKIYFYVNKQKKHVYILRVLHTLRSAKKHIKISLPYIKDENMT